MCQSHSGALKVEDWSVDQIVPILRSACHSVKCQYKAYGETEEYYRLVAGVPAQTNQDSFPYKRTAFYSDFTGKMGLFFPQAATLHININTDGSPVALGHTATP